MNDDQDLLEIAFDKKDKTFFPGDTVRARLLFTLKNRKKTRAIRVTWQGMMRTFNSKFREKFMTDNNDDNAEEKVIFTYVECILGNGHVEVPLSEGLHEFHLDYLLPYHLPSSFKGTHGTVVYTLGAILDLDGIALAKTFFVDFYVIGVAKLSTNPDLLNPITVEKSFNVVSFLPFKLLCRKCEKQGILNCMLSLEKTGFHPGEPLQITAKIESLNDTFIRDVKLQLIQTITYKIYDKEKVDSDIVYSLSHWMAHDVDMINLNFDKFTIPSHILPTELGMNPKLKYRQIDDMTSTQSVSRHTTQADENLYTIQKTNNNLRISFKYTIALKVKCAGQWKSSVVAIPITIGGYEWEEAEVAQFKRDSLIEADESLDFQNLLAKKNNQVVSNIEFHGKQVEVEDNVNPHHSKFHIFNVLKGKETKDKPKVEGKDSKDSKDRPKVEIKDSKDQTKKVAIQGSKELSKASGK